MFVSLGSIGLYLCIPVSLCIHSIGGLTYCLILMHAATLNRVPVSLKHTDSGAFAYTPAITSSSAFHEVTAPTCLSKARLLHSGEVHSGLHGFGLPTPDKEAAESQDTKSLLL